MKEALAQSSSRHIGSHRQESHVSIDVLSTAPFALDVASDFVKVHNSAVLAGDTNSSTKAITVSSDGTIASDGGQISISVLNSQVAKVSVNTSFDFVGARFTTDEANYFYGVWEYPFNDRQLDNAGVEFQLKGVGFVTGVNWANARAPFFITNAGYGVYADTLEMGTYDFSQPGRAEFNFNTSSLVYYIILPKRPNDYKSILTAYADLSNTIDMPPDSGYGPIFWSDDWTTDLHGLNNSQESYFDTVDHLLEYQIHGTAMFADRPYGTGNRSFGNFDFDPEFYPTPGEYIANLSDYGFDFQVWVSVSRTRDSVGLDGASPL